MSFDRDPFAPPMGPAAPTGDPFAPSGRQASDPRDPFAPFSPLAPASKPRLADGKISPTISVEIATDPEGRRKDIDQFTLVDDLRSLYDPFSFSIPNPEGRFNYMLAYRHYPITIWHADPFVGDGQERLWLKGVVVRVEQDTSKSGALLRFTGYDLGWLLTSHAPYWYNLKGKTWPRLCATLLDPSWTNNKYGFRSITGINFAPLIRAGKGTPAMINARKEASDLGKAVNLGRELIVQSLTYSRNQVIPRIQIQPGEPVSDVLVRYARLDKRLVNVSPEGDLMFFVPDRKQGISHSFNWHWDPKRQKDNSPITTVNYSLDGEPIYNDVTIVGSTVYPIVRPNQDDPNEGKFGKSKVQLGIAGPSSAPSTTTPIASFRRRWSGIDGERYTSQMAQARADWRFNMNLFEGESWSATIQGHSLFGIPFCSGLRADIHDSKNGIDKTMLVTRVQFNQSRQSGTTTNITCKPEGLLDA